MRSGEDLTPAERAELDKEVDKYAAEKEAFWRTKADAKDWDSVRADLEVYALAGEKVAEDPRRTEPRSGSSPMTASPPGRRSRPSLTV